MHMLQAQFLLSLRLLDPQDTEKMTAFFNSVSLGIMNDVAPLRLKTPKLYSQPWYNNETRAIKQAFRKAERSFLINGVVPPCLKQAVALILRS